MPVALATASPRRADGSGARVAQEPLEYRSCAMENPEGSPAALTVARSIGGPSLRAANKRAPALPSALRVTLSTSSVPAKKSTVNVKTSKTFGSSSNPTIEAGREKLNLSELTFWVKSTGGVADSDSGGEDHVPHDSGTCRLSSGVLNETV